MIRHIENEDVEFVTETFAFSLDDGISRDLSRRLAGDTITDMARILETNSNTSEPSDTAPTPAAASARQCHGCQQQISLNDGHADDGVYDCGEYT